MAKKLDEEAVKLLGICYNTLARIYVYKDTPPEESTAAQCLDAIGKLIDIPQDEKVKEWLSQH